MKCLFSEIQFAFGVMNELVNYYFKPQKVWGVPMFPTQRKEKYVGYDVGIKGPVRTLFFQFKVPEKKTTSKGKYWRSFGGPYYEFKIWPDNLTHQHNELVDLAKDLRHEVYYCAPGFHTDEGFEEYYQNIMISKKSIYVPCTRLPKIKGNDEHDISYTLEPYRISLMHSDESVIQSFNLEELKIHSKSVDSYENVHECLLHIAKIFSIDVRYADGDREMFNEIAYYLLINKNLNMVLLSVE